VHASVHILGEFGVAGLNQVQKVRVTHLLDPRISLDRELSLQRQLDVLVWKAHVESASKNCLKVAERQELLPWPCQRLEDVIDTVVFLQDNLLLVDLHSSLEVDAVVEESHQRLHIQFVLHFIARHSVKPARASASMCV